MGKMYVNLSNVTNFFYNEQVDKTIVFLVSGGGAKVNYVSFKGNITDYIKKAIENKGKWFSADCEE